MFCNNCENWKKTSAGENTEFGFCRANPPIFSEKNGYAFPVTPSHEYCGSYSIHIADLDGEEYDDLN